MNLFHSQLLVIGEIAFGLRAHPRLRGLPGGGRSLAKPVSATQIPY
jgi:hypothetical protein